MKLSRQKLSKLIRKRQNGSIYGSNGQQKGFWDEINQEGQIFAEQPEYGFSKTTQLI
ncbi:hypothetical protein LOAG_14811 [Loa loa]|uniref:Uncharacterized protein n=1 Tax=Loa loa TaxID=7209 RepID=A0A1S0TGY4_LOALO|nr:hypothetical protein LOAG_14811 [Loa loa]EFO13716.1 hypothetical protein LOAG_14811 [Loa loa]